jgi:hypothetical protein
MAIFILKRLKRRHFFYLLKKERDIIMATIRKLKLFIGLYFTFIVLLLLNVILTPMLIRHDISMTHHIIIDEEVFEVALILFLFLISIFMAKGFKQALKAYEHAADQAHVEKSRLISRLSEAFTYISKVNVGIQEIQSIICGVDHYPKSKKEFKKIFDHLTNKAATIAGTPWSAIRIIEKIDGRTITEHATEIKKGKLPSKTVGNRMIIEKQQKKDLTTIPSCHENEDLLTVCILPTTSITKESITLLTVIANQAEMYFMLYRTHFLNNAFIDNHAQIEEFYHTIT